MKLKTRTVISFVYIIIGLTLSVLGYAGVIKNDIIFSFGTVFTVCGLAQATRNIRLIKNPDAMKKREIAEKDERNIFIYEKARSLAVSIFTIVSGSAVCILYIMGYKLEGLVISYVLSGFVLIYWICYLIVKNKY